MLSTENERVPRASLSGARGVVLTLAAMVAAVILAGGCATGNEASSAPAASDPRGLKVFSGADGKVVAWADMVAAAKGADAVLVGENHSHPVGLPSAAALWDDLIAAAPRAALAMEFFERDTQAALDDYVGGLTDEKAFRDASKRTDSGYPPGHRQMVEAAKKAHRPVIAANASRRYVRIARTDGYDKLRAFTPEQQRLFRLPDVLPTDRYRESFDKLMGGMSDGHGGGAKNQTEQDKEKAEKQKKERLDAAFRSQSLWDWTMAESVARSIDAGNSPTLLVVGRFHVDHHGGTPQALERLRPGTRIVTVSYVDVWSDTLRDEDKGRADFVMYVGPGPDDDK